MDSLRKYTGGDPKLYRELLEIFAEEAETIVVEAKQAIPANDAIARTKSVPTSARTRLISPLAFKAVAWKEDFS